MAPPLIHILLIEDDPGSARLIRDLLARARCAAFTLESVDRLATAVSRLSQKDIDVVLLDLGLPDSEGIDTVQRLMAELPGGPPIAVLTDLEDEELGERAIGAGAQDYVAKARLDADQIERVVCSAIARGRAAQALRDESYYRSLYENSDDAMLLTAPDGRILAANPAACRMFGRSEAEICQAGGSGILDRSDPRLAVALQERERTGRARSELTFLRSDGQPFEGEATSVVYWDENAQPRTSMVIRDITGRKHVEQQLAEYAAQLHAIPLRLVELMEAERYNVARELHDEIGQVITAVRTSLEAIRLMPEAACLNGHLAESIAIVDHALEQVRTLALDLRPAILDDFGLVATLEWYLERHASSALYSIDFHSDLHDVRFPSTTETTCFRIVQSALTNVARHAQATHVGITLGLLVDTSELELIVRDNGVGFDVLATLERARAGESMGLLSMQERVELAGGQILIDSAPGDGTEILVRLPIGVEG